MMDPEFYNVDYWGPFKWIKRNWHRWPSDVPPVQVWGNVAPGDHLDVPKPGHWTIAGYKRWRIPVMFAMQTRGRRYFRLGFIRYDYLKKFYTAPTGAYRNYSKGES
jgi:hypothetical protein